MKTIKFLQRLRFFFVSVACTFSCINSLAAESSKVNLRTISPFSLGSLCQAAEIMMTAVVSGDVDIAGLEIYKNQKMNGTCGGMKSLYPWLTIDEHKKSISISVQFESNAESQDRGFHIITVDNKNVVQKISMLRRWRKNELGPTRKEMLERFIDRYGDPAVMHSGFTDDSEYTIQMIWGSSFQQRPEFRKNGTRIISADDLMKEVGRLGCKEIKSIEASASCAVKASNKVNKPISDILRIENDVLVNASILVNRQSDTIMEMILSTEYVPAMHLMDELDKKKQVEQEKRRENERSKSIPKF